MKLPVELENSKTFDEKSQILSRLDGSCGSHVTQRHAVLAGYVLRRLCLVLRPVPLSNPGVHKLCLLPWDPQGLNQFVLRGARNYYNVIRVGDRFPDANGLNKSDIAGHCFGAAEPNHVIHRDDLQHSWGHSGRKNWVSRPVNIDCVPSRQICAT